MKKNFYLIILTIAFFATACQEQLPGVSPYSPEKELISFTFLKANNPSLDKDYPATIEGQSINIEVPKGIDLKKLVPTFTLSDKATIQIGGVELESGITAVDFSHAVTVNVLAQNRSSNKFFSSILLVGITANLQANTTTSYQNYLNNNLYTDLSVAIPTTSLNNAYNADSYNGRAYGDFDKDGDLDVIASVNNTYGSKSVDVEYFRNDIFQFVKDQSAFTGSAPKMLNARKVIVGDFDNNGWLDVAIAGSGFDVSPYAGETVKILMNFNGKFTAKDLNIGNGYYASLTAGDIDNDGDLDLFITNNQNVGKFMVNDGKGNFTYDATLYPGELFGKGFFASELYDINNDGYLDLVTAGHEHNGTASTVFFGNASGTIMASRSVTLPKISDFGVVVDIDFIDYNKDGKMDVLLTRTGDGRGEQGYYNGYYLQLLKNNGTSFEDVTKTTITNNSNAVAKNMINWIRIQDVDNDGDLDITTDDKSYGLSWINNNGAFSLKN